MAFDFIIKLFFTKNNNPDKMLFLTGDWMSRNLNKINRDNEWFVTKRR